ncbi:hypothetical protein PCASD_03189 [Puccinia coronata f. sp. avenae]|uniref:Uncharacterized protein n=1 Tax=Puccinia coronata f. sp. avenae TaxID=200324 RepID=A0A2N5VFC7_9BASI|nr:hypothetical protein PCASD_03189 [Puccinia coronata f. sp. avenae]
MLRRNQPTQGNTTMLDLLPRRHLPSLLIAIPPLDNTRNQHTPLVVCLPHPTGQFLALHPMAECSPLGARGERAGGSIGRSARKAAIDAFHQLLSKITCSERHARSSAPEYEQDGRRHTLNQLASNAQQQQHMRGSSPAPSARRSTLEQPSSSSHDPYKRSHSPAASSIRRSTLTEPAAGKHVPTRQLSCWCAAEDDAGPARLIRSLPAR